MSTCELDSKYTEVFTCSTLTIFNLHVSNSLLVSLTQSCMILTCDFACYASCSYSFVNLSLSATVVWKSVIVTDSLASLLPSFSFERLILILYVKPYILITDFRSMCSCRMIFGFEIHLVPLCEVLFSLEDEQNRLSSVLLLFDIMR